MTFAKIALKGLLHFAVIYTDPDEYAVSVDKVVAEIAVQHHLTEQSADLAKRAAAGFVYVSVCEGTEFDDAVGAIQFIMAAHADVPYEAAALEAVGVYVRAAFGRKNPALCAKALLDAKGGKGQIRK